MSSRWARYSAVAVVILTLAMLSYVGLRIRLLKLSYSIDAESRQLAESREFLRQLTYEVSSMKALPALEQLSTQLAVPLAQPDQVRHISHPNTQVPIETLESVSAPARFFAHFSLVPEALAKTDDHSRS